MEFPRYTMTQVFDGRLDFSVFKYFQIFLWPQYFANHIVCDVIGAPFSTKSSTTLYFPYSTAAGRSLITVNHLTHY